MREFKEDAGELERGKESTTSRNKEKKEIAVFRQNGEIKRDNSNVDDPAWEKFFSSCEKFTRAYFENQSTVRGEIATLIFLWFNYFPNVFHFLYIVLVWRNLHHTQIDLQSAEWNQVSHYICLIVYRTRFNVSMLTAAINWRLNTLTWLTSK